jgi:hypothetical protein
VLRARDQAQMDRLSPTPVYRLDPEVLIAHVLDDVEALQNYSVTGFLEGWFCGAKLAEVKRGERCRSSAEKNESH